VAVINGRITERSFGRYRLIRPLVRRWLQKISLFCVQNETYAERLVALGAPDERVTVTGSMKFDATPAAPPTRRDDALAASLGLQPDEPLIVGGCTWPGEDEALLSAYQKLRAEIPGLRLLLAPRQRDRFDPVDRLIRQAGFASFRRTTGSATAPAGGVAAASPSQPVILLDTIGELDRVYELATVAFVGGSLTPVGGHAIMLCGALAKPVLFGPYTENIRDTADEFLAHDAARRVADAAELEAALRRLLRDPAEAAAVGARARQIVDRHRGATSRTLAALEPLFHRPVQEGSHVS
jgi:3-deoxy-D-manno-octulosonic-acid transferase